MSRTQLPRLRRGTLIVLAIAIAATTAACAGTNIQEESPCGAENSARRWERLTVPPPHAEVYRRIAQANRIFPALSGQRDEWFSLPGQVMLCRREASAGEWWQFADGESGEPKLIGRDGWIVTYH